MKTAELDVTPKVYKRKFVTKRKRLTAVSQFIRILLIIAWASGVLLEGMKYGNPYAVLPSAALFGLMAAVLWFTVGSIRTEDTIEWIECVEREEDTKSDVTEIQSDDKN